jgi:hypothetical protein
MKAHDDRDNDGIFQNDQHVRDLEAARAGEAGDRMGGFYGLGRNEGRNAMLRMREVAGEAFTMDYTPSASTTTSPMPDNDARGLVRHSGMIYDAADGIIIQDGEAITDPERRHEHTGITTQDQSYADPRTQAREYDKSTPVVPDMPQMSPDDEERFRRQYWLAAAQRVRAGEAAQRDLVANPALTPTAQKCKASQSVDDAVLQGMQEGVAARSRTARHLEGG